MVVRIVHELAVMESVVDAVIDQIGDERVGVVRLQIGELAGVAIDALEFCFATCTRDTVLADATLDIARIPGRARCRNCGEEHPIARLGTPCPCGSFDRELVAGTELRLVEVEVL